MKTKIGLEIHVELLTKTKMFCSCRNRFEEEPNKNICPVCMAYPGMLPVLNRQALFLAVRAGHLLHCQIDRTVRFDRKKYFYPDSPKGYQVTQEVRPLCTKGYLDIPIPGGKKRIEIRRIHMEEDAAKSIHEGDKTKVDFNRAGVPLIEIVTEPVLENEEETKEFLYLLRDSLVDAQITDGKMEEGSMRIDLNINLESDQGKTQITEVKNLGSIRSAAEAIAYERKRQVEDYQEDAPKETRRYDERRKKTVLMRVKNTEEDYRYSQEFDLPVFHLDESFLEEARWKDPLPERLEAYEAAGLSRKQANFFQTSPWREYLDAFLDREDLPEIVDLIQNTIAPLYKKGKTISVQQVADYLLLEEEGRTNAQLRKRIFKEIQEGEDLLAFVEEKNLYPISDQAVLSQIVDELLGDLPKETKGLRGRLIGKTMKKTGQLADIEALQEVLDEKGIK